MLQQREDSLLPTIQRAKDAGLSREEVWKTMSAQTQEAARRGKWRKSELATTLADYKILIDKVYGEAP